MTNELSVFPLTGVAGSAHRIPVPGRLLPGHDWPQVAGRGDIAMFQRILPHEFAEGRLQIRDGNT